MGPDLKGIWTRRNGSRSEGNLEWVEIRRESRSEDNLDEKGMGPDWKAL